MVKDWLDGVLDAGTVIGAMTLVTTATFLLLRARAKSISALRNGLARSWTNEGDTTGQEHPFVDLDLRLAEGGLVGQVTSKAADRPFEAHVYVGWARATLDVFELRRRSLAIVGRARLRLTDDRNRLDWRLLGHGGEKVLPKRTKLWPNPNRPSRLRFKRHRLD
jgi:hypothetical protein